MSSTRSFAIVGSEDIIDQVFEIGEFIGKEGWRILNISSNKIEVGNPANEAEKTTLHLAN